MAFCSCPLRIVSIQDDPQRKGKKIVTLKGPIYVPKSYAVAYFNKKRAQNEAPIHIDHDKLHKRISLALDSGEVTLDKSEEIIHQGQFTEHIEDKESKKSDDNILKNYIDETLLVNSENKDSVAQNLIKEKLDMIEHTSSDEMGDIKTHKSFRYPESKVSLSAVVSRRIKRRNSIRSRNTGPGGLGWSSRDSFRKPSSEQNNTSPLRRDISNIMHIMAKDHWMGDDKSMTSLPSTLSKSSANIVTQKNESKRFSSFISKHLKFLENQDAPELSLDSEIIMTIEGLEGQSTTGTIKPVIKNVRRKSIIEGKRSILSRSSEAGHMEEELFPELDKLPSVVRVSHTQEQLIAENLEKMNEYRETQLNPQLHVQRTSQGEMLHVSSLSMGLKKSDAGPKSSKEKTSPSGCEKLKAKFQKFIQKCKRKQENKTKDCNEENNDCIR